MNTFVRPPQVWRQKAQYLQHKQNKAEATTVKHKSVTETKSKGLETIIDSSDTYCTSSATAWGPLWSSLLYLHLYFHSFSNRNGGGVTEQSAHRGRTLPRKSPRGWSHWRSSSPAAPRRVSVPDWPSTAGDRGTFNLWRFQFEFELEKPRLSCIMVWLSA